MSDTKKILSMIKEHGVQYVSFRFVNPAGKWQHTDQAVCTIDEDLLNEGIMFDGSSIAGWKGIEESDMLLKPDLASAVIDPFSADHTILVLFCDVLEPSTGKPYNRDPRGIARRAEAYLKESGIGDTAYFGPEAEFFVFRDVRYKNSATTSFYSVRSDEGLFDAEFEGDKLFPEGVSGFRIPNKGGYFPVAPMDQGSELRAEMLSTLADMGVEVEKHHHEVAIAQHELGVKFGTLMNMADTMVKYKYVVQMVAHQYGLSATFMPKPVVGDNGSGMHCHQSIWKGGKPLFAGDEYAGLSENALYYIGGIIKHARALNAFTNPSTNSYKRLIPGFEAPVLLAYSSRNRSASIRIPFVNSPNGKRIEVRFPDPTANPYLAFSAMLMAGLDGIKNKIHPGAAMDKNLYDLPAEELKKVPAVCGSLREALEALDQDRAFLTAGGVFDNDMIDAFIELKMQEVYRLEHTTHPVEFEQYFTA
jgi:glutamine synthetase